MHHLVSATKKALSEKNWYAALTMALSLPDICGRLEDPTKKSQERFEAWWSKYALSSFKFQIGDESHEFLNASDCYALRCAYLHQGEFGIEDQRARKALARVTFRAPDPDDFSHLISNGKVLHMKVDMFCTAVCTGVEKWLVDVRENQVVQDRLGKLGKIASA